MNGTWASTGPIVYCIDEEGSLRGNEFVRRVGIEMKVKKDRDESTEEDEGGKGGKSARKWACNYNNYRYIYRRSHTHGIDQ